jgi:hypothetical protein
MQNQTIGNTESRADGSALFAELDKAFYLERFQAEGIAIEPYQAAARREPLRDFRKAEAYLRSQASSWMQLLEAAARAIGPMLPDCRLAILVPCRFEEKRIHACLAGISRQMRDPGNARRFETIILDNHLENEAPDRTEGVVEDFLGRLDQPLPIRYHRLRFNREQGHFGLSLARKFLADLALLRSLLRGPSCAPLYLASMDADVVDIEAGTFEAVIRRMDSHAWLDAIRGIQDRQPEILCRSPLLFLERRSWYFAEKLLSMRRLWPDRFPESNFTWNRNVTGGWNTYFSAAAYASVGGYSRLRFLEDLDIGNRISVMRGHEARGGFRHDVRAIGSLPFRMSSSPVRFLQALLAGGEPYSSRNGYESFFAEETDRIVKGNDLSGLLDKLRARGGPEGAAKAGFDDVLGKVHSSLRGILPTHADRIFERVMFFLGFAPKDYALTAHGPDIRDYGSFLRRTEAYRLGRRAE